MKNLNIKKFISLFSIVAIATFSLSFTPVAATGADLKLEGPLFEESLEPHPVDPDSFQGKIIQAIKKVSPAVVSISTERTVSVPGFGGEGFSGPPFGEFDEFFRKFFEQFPEKKFKQKGLGTGMIINEDGYILTNEHVIHGVDRDAIKVTLPDNKTYKAEVVETDVESDIAVLKIEGDDFPHVVLGDSENIQVGQWVIALGNPFGYALSQLNKKYEPTVTVGVISATGRAIQAGGGQGGGRVYTDVIQTDASINPGNSGGPLINIYGEVVGVNTAILSPTGGSVGIGFTIPVNKAKRLLQSLAKYGEIKWPWIGIYMQELTPELAEKFGVEKGVLVADVIKSSPAEKAGIKAGDIIQQVNGKSVDAPLGLKEAVQKAKIGEKLQLTLMREGKKVQIELRTAPKPEQITEAKVEEEALSSQLLGLKVEQLNPELRQRYGIGQEETGVVVTEVLPGGPSSKVGITEGDVIKGINRQRVESVEEFKAAMENIQAGETVLLRVRHGSWTMFVTVETAKQSK